MNTTNEDDTFTALIKLSFNDICSVVNNVSTSKEDELEMFLSKYGWTIEEYSQELCEYAAREFGDCDFDEDEE